MSSTNKTAELHLSQFIGTDIPSILTDYNGDMQKIDAGVREVKQATAGAVSDLSSVTARVTNAEQDISGLNSTVQGIATKVVTAEGDIDTINSNVSTLSDKVDNLKPSTSTPQVFYGTNYNTTSAMLKAITDYINNNSLDVNNVIIEAYNKTLFLDYDAGTNNLHFSSLPSVVENGDVISYYFVLGDNNVIQSTGYKITNGTSSVITTVPTMIVVRSKTIE